MKKLHLLRHAKSCWKNKLLEDEDRPLNSRGKRNCVLMAEKLSKMLNSELTIFCSPARRAQDTITRILHHANIEKQYQICQTLYTFNVQDLVCFINELDNKYEQVLLIGHNPALTHLINLTNTLHLDNLPTCSYICLTSDHLTDWRHTTKINWQIEDFISPQNKSVTANC